MVLNEDKQAKLADALTRRQGAFGAVGTSAPHALVSAAAAPSPTLFTSIATVPLVVAQASPTPPPREEDKGVVEIESDEDSAEGPVFKRRKATMAVTSHSSTTSHPASLRDQPPSASSPPDLLEVGGESTLATPSAPELPAVLQHSLKGFQKGVTEDSDEASTRERLGLNFGALLALSNALISRTKVRVALVEAKLRRKRTWWRRRKRRRWPCWLVRSPTARLP